MDFDFTTETITPDTTNILTIGGTGGLELSVGTTGERPVSPINGTIRYNISSNTIEGYSNSSWVPLDKDGTVTSIDIAAGSGIGVSGGPITTSGTITITNNGVLSLSGTSNQVTASSSTGDITLSIPTTFIAPGSLQYTTEFAYTGASVVATGTTQATAFQISKTGIVIVGGAAATGIIMPSSPINGEIHYIKNFSGSIKNIWPQTGAAIGTGTVNSNTYINNGATMSFSWSQTGNTWLSLTEAIAAGNSGITISNIQGNTVITNAGVLTFSGGSTGLTPSSATNGAVTLGGTLGISNGGTGATTPQNAFDALSPATTAGDIIYSNGTNSVRLPIGTNTQVLSVSGSAPSWINQSAINAGTAVTATSATTATNLAGGALGSIPYQSAAGVTTFLTIGTSSQVLIGGTTPSYVSVPTALGYTPVNKAGDTMSGTLNMGTNYITNVISPVNPQDAATKAYVDSVATGIDIHDPVKAATVSNLTATYTNGTTDANGGLGIGATLTNSGTQAAFTVDGYSASLNDRILVKNQTTTLQNGIYTVTTLGTGSTNWVLTRAADANDSVANQVTDGNYVFVSFGSTNMNSGWVQTQVLPIIGTDPILFSQFSASNTYTAGTGLSLTGSQFSNAGVLSVTTNTGLSTNSSATGNVTITNTGVTSIIAGAGISVSGSTGAVTITALATLSTLEKTANYTMVNGNFTIFADGTSGPFTVTLPPSPTDGQIHLIKKIDETRSIITLNGNGANIDKYTTVAINAPFMCIEVQWNATSSRWQIV